MPELRIILLVVGVLIVGAIAAWEWWRARGSRPFVASASVEDSNQDSSPGRVMQQPLPEINVVRDTRVSVADSLPVIEIGAAPAQPFTGSAGISISDEVAVDVPNEPLSVTPRRDEPFIGDGVELSSVRVAEAPAFAAPPAIPVTEELPAPAPRTEDAGRGPQIVLAWPSENERRIVMLRLIPRTEPRFGGRALRQAFASAGFWHGPMDIYHLPDDQGRAIVSAAALAQPGTFDPSIMDSQRFSGLSMFAVLPGPLDERETFDELVRAARALAERLEGSITDQHGEELTPPRIARLRQSLGADAPQARASGEA